MTRRIGVYLVCALAFLGVLFLPVHTYVYSQGHRVVKPLTYAFVTRAIFGSETQIDFTVLALEIG